MTPMTPMTGAAGVGALGVLGAYVWLFASTPTPKDIEASGPGLVAFLIVAGLVIVCVLLFLSMRHHLRRVTFNEDETHPSTRE